MAMSLRDWLPDALPNYDDLYNRLSRLFRRYGGWNAWALTEAAGGYRIVVYHSPGAPLPEFLRRFDVPGIRIEEASLGQVVAPRPAPAEDVREGAIGPGAFLNLRAPRDTPNGTLGCLVETPEGLWGVSASHVLSGNLRYRFTADPQQGIYLGTRRLSRTVIFEPIAAHGNTADAAAFLLDGRLRPEQGFPPGWTVIADPVRGEVRPGAEVCLLSRQRPIPGRVRASDEITVKIGMPGLPDSLTGGDLGVAAFASMILVELTDSGFGAPGNSGGLVLHHLGNNRYQPLGLLTGTTVPTEGTPASLAVTRLEKALLTLGLPQRIVV